MGDAKRMLDKYKEKDAEHKRQEEALQAELAALRAGGAGGAGDGAGAGGGSAGGGRREEELEMAVATLKQDVAACAEERDQAVARLAQLKRQAEARLKADRARYTAHLDALRQQGMDPGPALPASPEEGAGEGAAAVAEAEAESDADSFDAAPVAAVVQGVGSLLKSFW
jgi:hypothetical protein